VLISTERFLPLSPSVSIHLRSPVAGSAPSPRPAEPRELQGLLSLHRQQKSSLGPPQGENTLLGAGLRDRSPPAPGVYPEFLQPQAREGLGACLGPARAGRARPAIKEANTYSRGLKGEKMVTDAGTLSALLQSRLSAGLRLSPSKADLFLALFTPSFSADTSVHRSRCVLSTQRGVLQSAKQPCNKAKK